MGVFKDEAEVHQYLGGIFEKAMEDDALSDALAASGVILRIHYTDPVSSVTVDMPSKKVLSGDTSLTPTVELFMSADLGNQFWLGKVNLPVAMAKGTVRAKGPVPKILKVIPVAKQLFPRYVGMLTDADRKDLLNA